MKILAMLLLANCVFIGSQELKQGGEDFCATGAFEEVRVEWVKDGDPFIMTYTLSEKGLEDYDADFRRFTLFFSEIIGELGAMGVYAETRFVHGGETLVICKADMEAQETLCEMGKDE